MVGTKAIATCAIVVGLAVVGGTTTAAAANPSTAKAAATVAPTGAPAVAGPNFQGGWDRNHFWLKATSGDIAAGIVELACERLLPVVGWYVCPPIAHVAHDIVGGSHGVWAEIYPRAPVWYWRIGTW